MADRIHNLYELGYLDVQEWLKETDVVLVPIGSCEQHGRHLPVSVDGLAALQAVQRAAKKASVPHTPLIWFGYSPQHLRGPGEGSGTITLRPETYQALLYDVGRCLVHMGFNKIIYATGHTSNMKVVDPPLRRIRYETGALPCVFRADSEGTPVLLQGILENPPEETPGWHGSEVESSTTMAYNESLVHLERTDKDRTHAPRWLPQDKFSKQNGSAYVTFQNHDLLYMPMEHREYSDTGLIGNPFRASAEKGDRILDMVSDYFAALIEEIKALKVEVRNRDYTEGKI
jgi:creatinine amidohydrolase